MGRLDSILMELRCGGDGVACYVFDESAKC